MTLMFLPVLAQYHTATRSDALATLLPVVLLLLVLYFVFRRQFKTMKTQQEDMERRHQHMQRVEELLERILNALERRQ